MTDHALVDGDIDQDRMIGHDAVQRLNLDDKLADGDIDQDRMIVLSVKPRFARDIIAGNKTVELRRVEPKIVVPTRGLIYATSPERALVGTCIVTAVKSGRLEALWSAFGPKTGLSRQEFLRYFNGVDKGTALTLTQAEPLRREVSLTDLRSRPRGFRPPQSFAYVKTAIGEGFLQMAA